MYKRKIPIEGLPASGVFETMRSYNGGIFKLNEHINRFFESCNSLSMKVPYDKPHLGRMLRSSLARTRLKNAYIRLALYKMDDKARLNLIVKPIASYPDIFYKKGVRIITVATKKLPLGAVSPQIKSSNFLTAVLAKIEAAQGSGFEPLMLSEKGIVAETAVSNIFIVKAELVMTSPVHSGLLRGITRDVVLRLAARRGLATKEVPFTRHNLYTADEVFLTSTIMEIVPVVEIDKRKIGEGRPGEFTKMLMEEYRNETRRKEN